MIQWKLGCRSRKQKLKNQPIAKPGIEHCHWFILPLLLATPTMQFSLDRKRRRHKQNECSASDSVGLIFTRSYRSTLQITTPTTTPSLVKTSLPYRPCGIHALPWGKRLLHYEWQCTLQTFLYLNMVSLTTKQVNIFSSLSGLVHILS